MTPEGVNIFEYHQRLTQEARDILQAFALKRPSENRFPWYLIQQVYLYIIARNETTDLNFPFKKRNTLLFRYQKFIKFLNGECEVDVKQRSIFSVLAFSAFGNDDILSQQKFSEKFIETLFFTAPSVASKYWLLIEEQASASQKKIAKKFGLEIGSPDNRGMELIEDRGIPLPEVASLLPNPFWEEENLLHLAKMTADRLEMGDLQTPWQIICKVKYIRNGDYSIPKLEWKTIDFLDNSPNGKEKFAEIFSVPVWSKAEDHKKRYKLGQILRFALRGDIDFYHNRKKTHNNIRPIRYSVPLSHWEQLRYGNFHGRTAFAPEWIPISSWLEDLLFELLRWPGAGTGQKKVSSFKKIKFKIDDRLKEIKEELRGKASGLLFLDQEAPPPYNTFKDDWRRPIRIGIVQSILPSFDDFISANSPELTDINFRKKHRQHLVTLIEGIEQMLRVRETHVSTTRFDKRFIDLLIFPELAVHPSDLEPILIPFVRRHRCIILAGLVFHKENILPRTPLINSAIWLIPEWNRERGFQIRRIIQGKFHLTEDEKNLNPPPVSFRPAQWIVNYEWKQKCDPVRISASICYDSTDLSLASDLKSRSDIFLVCALNKDVGTFDRMAESLHYHMYQGVMVVNNGQFGGSNFYVPFSDSFNRQVLHLHGQPQAQIAFIEIDPEKIICKGNANGICNNTECQKCNKKPMGKWKTPPADWTP